MITIDWRYRSREDIFEMWAKSTEMQRLGVTSYYGKMPENWSAGLPVARWLPTADSYERGGFPKAVDTALPLAPGQPSQEVTASAIWTCGAGIDIQLYPSAVTNLQTLIDSTLLALDDMFGTSGNYTVTGGRHMLKDDYQTESDGYALSIAIKIPTFRLQPRRTAGTTEITQEAEV